jgi:preprotein translocase subunit SecA
MLSKNELQNVISGNAEVKHGKIIQTIANFLRREKVAIQKSEKSEFFKIQETEILVDFIDLNNLWVNYIDESKYIGEGAEQKVYEFSDPKFVLKTNDSIFYEYWIDYFHSLLLHNFFFPQLAYELLGFYKSNTLYAVVKQPFVVSTENTNLENVKVFLSVNGFVNRKNNDYYNPDLGIIVEDLHDENVLTEDGSLQFIDTIFYLTPAFFEPE